MAIFHQCEKECSLYQDKDHIIPGNWVIDKWSFNRCPKSTIDNNIYHWLSAYALFDSGFLPNDGGWLSQSNKYISVMTFIKGKIGEHNAEK